jgi:hypothetical protein
MRSINQIVSATIPQLFVLISLFLAKLTAKAELYFQVGEFAVANPK